MDGKGGWVGLDLEGVISGQLRRSTTRWMEEEAQIQAVEGKEQEESRTDLGRRRLRRRERHFVSWDVSLHSTWRVKQNKQTNKQTDKPNLT